MATAPSATPTTAAGPPLDSFTYTLTDPDTLTDTATVNIVITQVAVHCVPDKFIDTPAGFTCGDGHGTIGLAITAHADQDETVLVAPGIYEENVDVTVQGLVLKGLKADPVLFSCLTDMPTQPCVFAGGTGSAITITASGVTLTGFKVIDSGGVPDAGIRVTSNSNTVRKNTALDNGGYGILIEGGVTGNTVDANNAHDNFGDGIHVVVGVEPVTTITDNKVHQNDGDGFEFNDILTTIVNGNRSNDNGNCGFRGDADYGTGTDRNRANKNTDGNFCESFPSGETGSIKGRVTDDVTGDTLEGVAVMADGFTDTTSGNGRYRLRNITAGDLFLTATVGGCANFGPVPVTIFADDATTRDIEMSCP